MRQIREPADAVWETGEEDIFHAGIDSVLYIRCYAHLAVRQMNTCEAGYAECAACAVDAVEGVITAVIVAIGGEVEGQPTSRVNFLQRVRKLVEKEKRAAAELEANKERGYIEGYADGLRENENDIQRTFRERDERLARLSKREICSDKSHKGYGLAGCLDCAETP